MRRVPLDLAFLAALTLLTNLLYFAYSGNFFYPDSRTYIEPARSMLAGHGFLRADGIIETFRTPGYPLFLMLFHSFTTVVVVQHVLNAALAIAIHLFARRRFSRGIAIAAAVIFAVDTPSIHYANKVLTETLFTLGLFALIWFVWGEMHAPHPAFGHPLPEGEGVERQIPLPPGEGAAKRRVRGVNLAQNTIEVWEIDGPILGYHVTHDVFFQVNRHLLRTMLRLVSDIAESTPVERTAVDLYSGVGFFSRPLAQIFERVTSIEGSRAAHECAKANAAPNVKLVNAPVEQWIDHMPRTDFVFLDPPRSGAKKNVIDAIARKTNERICFLACDPVTFARDASRLTASGWRLRTLDLLDLFPNTHHVETLSSFERAP